MGNNGRKGAFVPMNVILLLVVGVLVYLVATGGIRVPAQAGGTGTTVPSNVQTVQQLQYTTLKLRSLNSLNTTGPIPYQTANYRVYESDGQDLGAPTTAPTAAGVAGEMNVDLTKRGMTAYFYSVADTTAGCKLDGIDAGVAFVSRDCTNNYVLSGLKYAAVYDDTITNATLDATASAGSGHYRIVGSLTTMAQGDCVTKYIDISANKTAAAFGSFDGGMVWGVSFPSARFTKADITLSDNRVGSYAVITCPTKATDDGADVCFGRRAIKAGESPRMEVIFCASKGNPAATEDIVLEPYTVVYFEELTTGPKLDIADSGGTIKGWSLSGASQNVTLPLA